MTGASIMTRGKLAVEVGVVRRRKGKEEEKN